ncbi:LOW QUALITY PROTEIN: serine/threonine-protein kinase Sgk2b [Gadus chalcogrammus]|uniref:LOW QUALITY PROTEIN: serine/threonine-protein kinase Sgk2b n=1 Tax=Gadus chalcogrammus TaxID=1042646 RepID=UPI0024C4D0A5|nr:LOW QUALITY PROTEIN: serine/threonine-protein kinase Sgk2b [Gadus chalcogrammus]
MVERNVLLKGLQHPFLMGLQFSFQTTHRLYFVLEYVVPCVWLFCHLQMDRSFPEPSAAFYAAEIATALGNLHSLEVVYRDMKPENILLDRGGHVTLTDLGLCEEGMDMDGTMHIFCGTPEYLATEILRATPNSPAVDRWGLGTVLFETLHGLPHSTAAAERRRSTDHQRPSEAGRCCVFCSPVSADGTAGKRLLQTFRVDS